MGKWTIFTKCSPFPDRNAGTQDGHSYVDLDEGDGKKNNVLCIIFDAICYGTVIIIHIIININIISVLVVESLKADVLRTHVKLQVDCYMMTSNKKNKTEPLFFNYPNSTNS